LTQKELIFSYFKNNPNKVIHHPEVVDWATKEWKKLTGNEFRDPDRAIRSLAQEGSLVKISKGKYKYDPGFISNPQLEDFSEAQKIEVFKKCEHRCVICGKSREDGVELIVDHIKPKGLGGRAEVSNGQILCGKHSNQKDNYSQSETGKKLFIILLENAKKQDDKNMVKFCKEVLKVYDAFDMDDHIEWKK